MAKPDYSTVFSKWGLTAARYYAEPGAADLYLLSTKRSPRGTYRFFVPGIDTRKQYPNLADHPVIFEKRTFAVEHGEPTARPDVGKAREEMRKSQSIWKVFSTHMPQPLGVRDGAFLSAAIPGRSIKSLIPYISGHDGIADMGPALISASIPEGRTELTDLWKALSSAWAPLTALHDRGFSHGDVHTSNILVTKSSGEWRAGLIDFAMAQKATPTNIATDQQILLNHGRVIQALIGPQKGEYAAQARERGFHDRPGALREIAFLETRYRPSAKVPSLPTRLPVISTPQVSRNRTFA
jgi:serine/threonine protein kinase